MRFYTGQHRHYCGIDLHTKTMFLCVLGTRGEVLLERNTLANPESFLKAIAPFRGDLVVGCERTFMWYWLADLCEREGVAFVLGHALYMKAIHGGETPPSLDGSERPPGRSHHRPSPARRHLPARLRLPEREARHAGSLAAPYDRIIRRLERQLSKLVVIHDRRTYDLLRSIPGVGQILALILLYEIDEITRFDSVQQFCSYARLIRPKKTSADKPAGLPLHKKITGAHLKWAFSEAALLLLRESKAAGALRPAPDAAPRQRRSSRHPQS